MSRLEWCLPGHLRERPTHNKGARTILYAAIETVRSLTNPLASALLLLPNGLTRRTLLDGGATQHEVRIQGSSINYYEQGPQARSDALLPGNAGALASNSRSNARSCRSC